MTENLQGPLIGFSTPLKEPLDDEAGYYLPLFEDMTAPDGQSGLAQCRAIEVNAGSLTETADMPAAFRNLDRRFDFVSLHLATRTATAQDGQLQLAKASIGWAQQLGAEHLTLHPSRDTRWADLLELCGEAGVRLSVENLDNLGSDLRQDENKFGQRFEDIQAILEAHPDLSFVHDLSHTWLASRLADVAMWNSLGGRTALYHVSGTDVPGGRAHAPICETGQYEITAAASLHDVPVIIESLGWFGGRRNTAELWQQELKAVASSLKVAP